jgi:hypothetical protein
MALTPARQRNAVSEGMALGLLMCGRDSLPYDKVRLDLSFEAAWRSWTYRTRFPQVNTDLSNGLDGVWAMTRADADKRVRVLYWEDDGRAFQICTRQPDWTPDAPDDLDYAVGMIAGDVPLTGWEELAREFLTRLSDRHSLVVGAGSAAGGGHDRESLREHVADDVLMPPCQQLGHVAHLATAAIEGGVGCERKVELVADLVALTLITSFDVEQDRVVGQGSVAGQRPSVGRSVASPIDQVKPPSHQGEPTVFIEVPHSVQTWQRLPLPLLLIGPLDLDTVPACHLNEPERL